MNQHVKNFVTSISLLTTVYPVGVIAAQVTTDTRNLPLITKIDFTSSKTVIAETSAGPMETTIIADIQIALANFLHAAGDPIAGVIIAEVGTGNILALVEGRSPKIWGGTQHTTLHNKFPAASLFKTTVAAAGIEIANLNPTEHIGLLGSCGEVSPVGSWMSTGTFRGIDQTMTLEKAYGHSCNSFFAKIAINIIGLGAILETAHTFRWGQNVPADFQIPVSELNFPDPMKASAHTVGKFAAGFGDVGTSVAHIAWLTLAIAKGGQPQNLKLFNTTSTSGSSTTRIMSTQTAKSILEIMGATVANGTASNAFRARKYRTYKHDAGGKTGTLTGHNPEGLTTWFTGIYPLSDPQIVVSTVAIIEDLWVYKANNISAEAIATWAENKKNQELAIIKANKGLNGLKTL